jgi:Uma2 family endonuclease
MTLPPPNAIIEPPWPPRRGLASFTDEELAQLDDLPSDDGEPLDTLWHRCAMNLLIETATFHFQDREDFFVGGNMFFYYNVAQQRQRDFRGPDFFFVWGVDRRRDRKYYAIWQENNRFPNVIVELLSPTTAAIDRGEKRDLYQNTFHTPEYFLCEPQVATLEGLRLNAQQVYEPIQANRHGWLWSEQLQLWLGAWYGEWSDQTTTWLRFYDAHGRLVPTFAEAARQNLEQEKQRAEQEKQRAEQEKQRAEAAIAEVERLRRELEELRQRLPKTQP